MLRLFARLLSWLIIVPASAWGLLALHYQLSFTPTQNLFILLTWVGLTAYVLHLYWQGSWKLGTLLYLVLHGELLLWWDSIEPSHERIWADDVAQLTTGEVNGNRVLLHNVRNFDWHSESQYQVRWEEREYNLESLRSVDMISSHWGMDSIAHILVSFGFNDGQFVTFSVEIRKEQHEQYSALGGFFKQYEVSIVASDERDAIAVRPNVRGEDTYLYRIAMPAHLRRALFLSYVEQANALADTPRFYNTLTVNCTTLVYSMLRQTGEVFPLDPRLLLTGYLPSYIQAQDGLMTGFDLQQLRELGHINQRSQAAAGQPNYSKRIRQGVPGWLHELQPQGLPF